jgi:hypothetical protein
MSDATLKQPSLIVISFMMILFCGISSNGKMEATYYSETYIVTLRYIPEDRTFITTAESGRNCSYTIIYE